MGAAREGDDLFHQSNDANDEADLGVVVIFAAVTDHTDVAGEVHQLFLAGNFGDVIGGPTDAAGEVANFDLHFAGKTAVDAPFQSVVHARRKTVVDDVHIIGVGECAKL